MTAELLLVGSVPLDTAEDVFRTFGEPLGAWLAAMPDGEVGPQALDQPRPLSGPVAASRSRDGAPPAA